MRWAKRIAPMLGGLLGALLGAPSIASVHVPIDIRPENGMLMVSGLVDGVPCRMLLDTGATHTTFDLGFVTNNLPKASLQGVEVVGRTNVGVIPKCFAVEALKVGEHVFPAARTMTIPLEGMTAAVGERVDGILGMSDLTTGDFILCEKEIIFEPDAAERTGFGPDARKGGDALRPRVAGRHNGRGVTLLVDSGSTYTFLRQGFWEASENDLPLTATEISGQSEIRPRLGVSGILDLGVPVPLRPMIVPTDHTCLGSDILKSCDIFIGEKGSRIAFRVPELRER